MSETICANLKTVFSRNDGRLKTSLYQEEYILSNHKLMKVVPVMIPQQIWYE